MQPANNKTDSRIADAFLLAGIVLLLVLRRPELLTAPRFWAEEGQVYFAHAFGTSFLDNLFSQFYGYYTLVPNLATGLAALVPLQLAPFVTTALAFLVHVQVCALVLFTRSPLWASSLQKAALCIGVILLSTGDVWLNTINSMYWLAAGTFFILLDETESPAPAALWHRRCYLLVAGLTGVVSCFMTPLFAFKAYQGKQRERAVHTAILAACSALQLIILVVAYRSGNSMLGERFTADSFSLQRVLVLNVFDPFLRGGWLDWEPVLRFDEHFLPLTQALAGDMPLHFFRVSVMAAEAAMILFFAYLFAARRASQPYRYLLGAYLLVTVLSTVSSLRMNSAPRYVFAPSCMLLTALVGSAMAGSAGLRRWQVRSVQGILALVLLVSAATFRPKIDRYFSPDISWPTEVAQWRNDAAYQPRIWPPGWSLELRSR